MKHRDGRLRFLVEQCDTRRLCHLRLRDTTAKISRRTVAYRQDLPLDLDIQPLTRQFPTDGKHQPPMRRFRALGDQAGFNEIHLSLGEDRMQRTKVVWMHTRIQGA